jgi:hypothetical protein
MHMLEHIRTIMKVRELVVKELGYPKEIMDQVQPSGIEQYIATYTLAVVISMQSEVVGDSLGRLDTNC